MKYCLGLDLGVGSIGSAVVELDENNNPKNIADAGVRIFEVSEGAQDRRIKRTARKNLIRTKKRLKLLAKKLKIRTYKKGIESQKSHEYITSYRNTFMGLFCLGQIQL